MDPILGASIITAITALLSGGMGGAAMGQERKYRAEQAEKIKPKVPFYQTPYLAGYDKVLMQAILGNLGTQMGDKSEGYGLDFSKILELMGQMGQSGQSQGMAPKPNQLTMGRG